MKYRQDIIIIGIDICPPLVTEYLTEYSLEANFPGLHTGYVALRRSSFVLHVCRSVLIVLL